MIPITHGQYPTASGIDSLLDNKFCEFSDSQNAITSIFERCRVKLSIQELLVKTFAVQAEARSTRYHVTLGF
jgi:hypothetical protein